jgi:hypothetical protein
MLPRPPHRNLGNRHEIGGSCDWPSVIGRPHRNEGKWVCATLLTYLSC